MSAPLRAASSPAERGVSLVEVLLSLVIVAGGLVVSAQGVGLALRLEGEAANRELASRLARDLVAELESGALALSDAEGPFDAEPGYRWRVEVGTTDVEGLSEAVVTVLWEERNAERTFEVVRWIFEDPEAGGADVAR